MEATAKVTAGRLSSNAKVREHAISSAREPFGVGCASTHGGSPLPIPPQSAAIRHGRSEVGEVSANDLLKMNCVCTIRARPSLAPEQECLVSFLRFENYRKQGIHAGSPADLVFEEASVDSACCPLLKWVVMR